MEELTSLNTLRKLTKREREIIKRLETEMITKEAETNAVRKNKCHNYENSSQAQEASK